jgi:hypothetical protein
VTPVEFRVMPQALRFVMQGQAHAPTAFPSRQPLRVDGDGVLRP